MFGVAALLASALALMLAPAPAPAAIGVPQQVADINPGASSSGPFDFAALGNRLVFRASNPALGTEPFVSDGTAAGTIPLADIGPGGIGSNPGGFATLGNSTVFFSATDAAGDELWASDGTPAGTRRLDIQPGPGSSVPRGLTRLGNRMLMRADDGSSGTELWSSDGTQAGTSMVADIEPGPGSGLTGFFFPEELGGRLYFQASEPVAGNELWRSDGTEDGTELVANVALAGSSTPREITRAGNRIFFTAELGGVGRELFVSDGNPGSGALVEDLDGAATDSGLTILHGFGGDLYFRAPDGANGVELWRSNGTPAGTEPLFDVNPAGSSNPSDFVNHLGWLYFAAATGADGRELWRTDGVPGGTTEQVADIDPAGSGMSCGNEDPLPFRGLLWFCADDGSSGRELWASNGTAAATARVADLNPGPGDSSPVGLTAVGDTLYFAADDGSSGTELWAFDTGAPDTIVDDGPAPGEHIATARPRLELDSTALDLDRFQCAGGGAGFALCAGSDGDARTAKLPDGPIALRVRAVDVRNNPDPSPEQLDFVVDTAAPKLKIKGKKARVSKRGRVKLKLRCPSSELTGPCKGRVKLKTRKKVRVGGKKRKLKLGRAKFKLDPGEKAKVKLKLRGKKKRLVRRESRARKVKAKARVRDGLRNKRKVGKKLTLKPRR